MLQAVFDQIEANREVYIAQLQELCRQPSVAVHGTGMAETADRVEAMLRDLGAEGTAQVPTAGYPYVCGELAGSGPKIVCCYNHYDVQPPDPLDAWTSDPWGAEIREGHLYARGAGDDKGELVSRIFAADAWKRAHGRPPVTVKFVFEGEEEIGSPNAKAFAQEHSERLRADGCIWEYGDKDPSGRPQIYLGLKGICVVQLHARGPSEDVHSMWGAILPNPMWRLVWALASIKDREENILLPGFGDHVRQPSEAELGALGRLPFDAEAWRKRFGIEGFVGGKSATEAKGRLNFASAVNIHGFSGGRTGRASTSIVPGHATVKLDIRLVPDQRVDDVLRQLREHLDREGFGDIEIEPLFRDEVARTPVDDPFVGACTRAAGAVYGVEPAVHLTMPGGGPMYNLCQALGVPAVSFGIAHAGSNLHGPDENISLEGFILGIKHVAATFYEFAQA